MKPTGKPRDAYSRRCRTRRGPRANRAFLARAVQFLTRDAGIRQFLDIGTVLPTPANVHKIAQLANPQAHVVYSDIDPMVVVHANALLANSLTVAATHADLRRVRAAGRAGVRGR